MGYSEQENRRVDVYLHSAGRDAFAAWPSSSQGAGRFVAIDQTHTFDEQVRTFSAQSFSESDAPQTLFAHSFLALVALAGLGTRENYPERLVLVKPALYDLVRGQADVERHIDAMSRARERVSRGDYYGYWTLVRPIMFGGELTPELWDTEQHRAITFSQRLEPWGHDVNVAAIAEVPTLVVTGAWNREYEVIACHLAEEYGAHHVRLAGHGHRPHDHPSFSSTIREFVSARG